MEEKKDETSEQEKRTQVDVVDIQKDEKMGLDHLANIEGIKMQFDTLLAEYNMIRNLVANARQTQSQLDGMTLTALGLSIPLILFIMEQSLDFSGIVLLLPILFFFIVFAQTRYERTIVTHATYVDSILRPNLIKLLSYTKVNQVEILEFEAFLARESSLKSIFLEWIATSSRSVLGFTASIIVMIIYIYLRQAAINPTWQPYEIVLFLINIFLLVGNLVNTYFVANQRLTYFTKQGYFK